MSWWFWISKYFTGYYVVRCFWRDSGWVFIQRDCRGEFYMRWSEVVHEKYNKKQKARDKKQTKKKKEKKRKGKTEEK